MDLINAAVNRDHIETLKKQLNKAELESVCHVISEQCLITLLKYQNIKRYIETMHKSKYIGIGAMVQSQKAKQKNGNQQWYSKASSEDRNPWSTQFNDISLQCNKKSGHKVSMKGDVDYDKHTYSVKNSYKKMRKQELLEMISIVVV